MVRHANTNDKNCYHSHSDILKPVPFTETIQIEGAYTNVHQKLNYCADVSNKFVFVCESREKVTEHMSVVLVS